MTETHNHVYLLRVWRERDHGKPAAFRASLTEVSTHETRYFADVRALAAHLKTLDDASFQSE